MFQQKRYAEAEAHFRQLLTRRLAPGVEADTRRRFADTLDVLGKAEEAAAERKRASQIALGTRRNPAALITQGDLLKRQNRSDEACEMYMQALALMPQIVSSGHSQVMAKLATAHYNMGRPVETLKWAEASLRNKPAKDIKRVMEAMAGVALTDMGELERAEGHYHRALKLAEADGKPEEVSRYMATIASIQHKRGYFDESIAFCQQIRQMTADPARVAYTTEAECLRDTGRFQEARSLMEQARRAPGYDQPHTERKMQALFALGTAWIETRANCPEAALLCLDQARAGLVAEAPATAVWPPAPRQNDDKILLWCDATATLALAQRGEAQKSRQMRETVLRHLPRFAQDRATGLGTYLNLARAALLCGDLAEAQAFLGQYQECKPNPLGFVSLHYWQGEIYLRLAETDAAREAFRQSVALGINSLEARRAQARLEELGG